MILRFARRAIRVSRAPEVPLGELHIAQRDACIESGHDECCSEYVR
jgi:hypothetical protein